MKIRDDNFVVQLKKGNEQALDYVIDNYGWVVKTVVRKQLYNLLEHEEECISDVFLAIWNNIAKFDDKKGDFKSWAAAIAKFKSIDYKRKYLKEIAHENIDNLDLSIKDSVHENIIKEEMEQDIQNMLSCLKEKDRELFRKLYIEEKHIDEVIEETGMKRDVIYNRVSRGKKKLKNIFKLIGSRG